MNNLFLEKVFSEHHLFPNGEDVTDHPYVRNIYFQGKSESKCVEVASLGEKKFLKTSYFVGLDWVLENKAIYVEPKFIGSNNKTDYFKMLYTALKHPDVPTDGLYEIKFSERPVIIDHSQDLITPLLIGQFLRLLKEIVRKGLKKSYYQIEGDLNSRIKGKVLVSKTIKTNTVRGNILKTVCRFDVFGFNGLENRLLKRTLLFAQRYLQTSPLPEAHDASVELLNFTIPSFTGISDQVELNELKHFKTNSFYKEYSQATHLAKLILKRFGYNINHTNGSAKILSPPFWIDMSKLFELYVLGLLKDRFKKDIHYHVTTYGNELDFLLVKKGMETVIDAKYKPLYQKRLDHSDIRQLSGYARNSKVYKILKKPEHENIDCLIVFPDNANGVERIEYDMKSDHRIVAEYVRFYKYGIKLPVIR